MKTLQRIATVLTVVSLSWSSAMTQAEDIDLFAPGSGAPAADPNLLIILDNTANWGQPLGGTTKFATVKTALVAAIDALTDASGNINVGLLLFNAAAGVVATGGQPTGSHDGAYVRYAARTMTSAANRAELAALISGLDAVSDRGAAAQPALALEEARRYLGGMPVLNGNNTGDKVDRSAMSTGRDTYISPLAVNGCQRNLVLLVSAGPPATDDQSIALPFVRALNDGLLPPRLTLPAPYPAPLLPASQDAAPNWTDELAALLQRAPYPGGFPAGAAGSATSIVTYAIAVHDPANTEDNTATAGSGRALMLNAAVRGGGKYFDTTDASSLARAVGAIFAEVQAVDMTFAAPALPASVNPLGTFANQVYMGMFRPDANGRPRWVGNLKQYQFAYNSSTGALELVDALGQSAINAGGGFIAPTAQSFWSAAQTSGPILPAGTATVDFFANAPAGIGLTPIQQTQEAPDGEVVDKGGVAQQVRAAYLGNQAARNVYTCPVAGCSAGAALSGTASYAFDTANFSCAAQQSAFGLSAATCATELPLLVNWIRGADNAGPGNEAAQGPAGLGASPVRASVHGDVLHSRPLLVNYGAQGIIAFYGANDGTLRAVRAGQPQSSGGQELWAFIAPETFSRLKRLRDAAPPLRMPSPSSGLPASAVPNTAAKPKDYFFDGALTNYEMRDSSGNVAKELLFVTARRGGSFIYAFDVTAPAAPRFLWKHSAHDGTDGAFDDLALTFSGAKAALVAGYANPVVIFGGGYFGGYDAAGAPIGEDADPAGSCLATMALGCGNRIFVLDAMSGSVLTTFQSNAGNGGDLVNSVAADLALVDSQGGGVIDRAYAADTGGNIWRIDFDQRGTSQWKMYKFATVGDAMNSRKFLFAPDVVVTRKFAAILIGSGDREKPLQTSGTDRFYMFKDKATDATVSGVANGWPLNGEDTTGNRMADAVAMTSERLLEVLAAENNNGWFHTLATGEKVVNGALTAAGITYFGTNRPAPTSGGTCPARLGVAKAYGLLFNIGTAGRDLNGDGLLDASDAAVTLAGGGLPPSPIAGWVNVVDAATDANVTVPFVIGAGGNSGGAIGLPSQSAPARINVNLSKARQKTYWYSKPPQ